MLGLGYDSPKERLSDDLLDRKRLALDIADVIRSTPAEFSARIGLFGRWGTGKSTILEMLASHLRESGYIIVRFNPATDESFADLIGSFSDRLVASLTAAGIYVEPKPKTLVRKARSWFKAKTTSDVVEGLGELHKGAKLVNAGLGFISTWLSPNGEQVQRMRDALPESRVLVLIDDLDRCSAELLPRLLLALKDILDLERFTFVLAFDQDIVADSIKTVNPAWGSGHRFLDKILDFRFSLPSVEKSVRARLLSSELNALAGFVPPESVEDVADLLPDNPRRLKALVRGLLGLRSVIQRHSPGEFSWTDVWLIELLRQESSELVERLSDKVVYDLFFGSEYQLWVYTAKRQGQQKEDKAQKFLDELKTLDDEARQRLLQLIEAIRARSSFGLPYVIRFANRAPALTWKEFFVAYEEWKVVRRPEALRAWLLQHAQRRQDAFGRVAEEFFTALTDHGESLRDKAVQKVSLPELEATYTEAFPLLDCIIDFFSYPDLATAERFITIYQQAQKWIGTHRDGVESRLRSAEFEMLVNAAKILNSEQQIVAFEQVDKPSESYMPWVDEDRRERVSALRQAVSRRLLPAVYTKLEEMLRLDGGLKRIGEPKVYQSLKKLLFEPRYLPWPPAIRKSILDALEGKVPQVISADFADGFLNLLRDGIAMRSEVSSDGAIFLIRDSELLSKLWEAANRRQLLDRGAVVLLATRVKFLQHGASEEVLPLSPSLSARVPLFEEHQQDLLAQI